MQLGFVVVRGRSMEPTYLDGDVLLVAYGLHPRVGCCHVVQLPDADDGPRPLAVKRVTQRIEPGASTTRDRSAGTGGPTWWVERDNPRDGVDSWLVGALPASAMRARVLGPRTADGARRARACVRHCRTLATTFRRARAAR